MRPAKRLALAAGAGELKKVKAMVEADPALARDWQPIMDACYLARVEVVAYLLEHGADPNIKSKSAHHYRPLHRTVEHKQSEPRGPRHVELAELLLEHGADPDGRGSHWQLTPLALAVRGGEAQFVPLLKGPTTNDIYTACVMADTRRVRTLLQKDPALATAADEANGWTPLRYCAESRPAGSGAKPRSYVAVARALVEAGAPPGDVLDPAIHSKNLELVRYLLDAGGEIRDGDTLNHAAQDRAYDVLDLLVERGVDLNDQRGTEHHGGYTPLGCCMHGRSLHGARWFLEQGVDPNDIGSAEGETALHAAVRYGCRAEMLKMLVDFGVKVNARDRAGRTALAVGREHKRRKQVEYLEKIGAR